MISEILHDQISYRARSTLESLGRPLLETTCGSFDVQAFVRAGRATMREKASIVQERLHGWHDGIYTHVDTGWLEVDWDGDTFDAIAIAWDSNGCRQCLYVKSVRSRCDTDHANIRDIFDRARQVAPCILVLEDIDALVTLVTDQNRSLTASILRWVNDRGDFGALIEREA